MASETAFLIDFLPVIRRTLTRSGFVIDHVQYYCDALKPWIARREQLGRFVLRRDPRDISRIWALDPDGGAYLEVPYRTLSRPPISAWEQQSAAARLRELGRADVDESCPVRDGGTDAPDHRRRRGHDPQGPPRPGTAHRDAGAVRNRDHDAPARARRHRSGGEAVRGDRAVVTDDGLDLSHLHPAAREIARLPADERLQYARADRWIGYTRAAEALGRLETLFAWPARQRMPNLLLTGPTNNGKSMIIEKFRRAHPPVSHPDREEIPVLVVQMPSDPSVGRFYTAAARRGRSPAAGRASQGGRPGAGRAAGPADGRRPGPGHRRAAQPAQRPGATGAGSS